VRVVTLENSCQVNTCTVCLVLGSASRREEVNTVVDTGHDPAIGPSLERAPTDMSKRPAEQMALPQSHPDHCALLPRLREMHRARVCAFSASVAGVDRVLEDGDATGTGDEDFEVVRTAGHSVDSIYLYGAREGVLFVRGMPLRIASGSGTYEEGFPVALERLCARHVRRIYFGHGPPMTEGCNGRLWESVAMAAAGLQIARPRSGTVGLRQATRRNPDQ
jgi:glyoxylase-like metal-dependent hydrolase (beta-lactamase superfamily II)